VVFRHRFATCADCLFSSSANSKHESLKAVMVECLILRRIDTDCSIGIRFLSLAQPSFIPLDSWDAREYMRDQLTTRENAECCWRGRPLPRCGNTPSKNISAHGRSYVELLAEEPAFPLQMKKPKATDNQPSAAGWAWPCSKCNRCFRHHGPHFCHTNLPSE